MKSGLVYALLATIALGVGNANAGPVIIDGTDANDHGSASGTTNLNGWEYMQRALENLAAARLAANPSAPKVVVDLGTSGGQAGSAINSAFSLSSLATTGWSLQHVDGEAAMTAYLATLSPSTTGILAITTRGLSSGDLTAGEMTVLNTNAGSIDAYVSGAGDPSQGGALWSMGESGAGSYGWLQALIPGIVVTDVGGGGVGSNITLTAAGTAAFPGLTNADLANADPWHNFFSGNLGGLSVLGTALQGNSTRTVIIGGGAGTQFAPEPGALSLFGLALFALLYVRRRFAQHRHWA